MPEDKLVMVFRNAAKQLVAVDPNGSWKVYDPVTKKFGAFAKGPMTLIPTAAPAGVEPPAQPAAAPPPPPVPPAPQAATGSPQPPPQPAASPPVTPERKEVTMKQMAKWATVVAVIAFVLGIGATNYVYSKLWPTAADVSASNKVIVAPEQKAPPAPVVDDSAVQNLAGRVAKVEADVASLGTKLDEAKAKAEEGLSALAKRLDQAEAALAALNKPAPKADDKVSAGKDQPPAPPEPPVAGQLPPAPQVADRSAGQMSPEDEELQQLNALLAKRLAAKHRF